MSWRWISFPTVLFCLLPAVSVFGQSPRVLYTWAGTGNVQAWYRNFGTNSVTLENLVDGELRVTETGAAGTGVAISDDFNRISEPSYPINNFLGGIDLTGLSSLEFDVGHSGAGAVNVQFFVQASSGSTYVALGADVPVTPGMNTYSLPLSGLTPVQLVFVRTIGMNIRDHVAEGNLVWTLREVRSAGTALSARDFATHEPGTSDNGLQGAYVNFDNSAVQGNVEIGTDKGQNQTGLLHNTDVSPPGNTGSMRWVDLATGNGAAVSWVNGTVFGGNTYGERPTDMSNYTNIAIRLAATNSGGNVPSVDVQYFLQTGNFSFFAAGADLTLAADGQFHELVFPLAGISNLDLVVAHGVNLRAHAEGDLIIDVDNIRAIFQIFPKQLAGDCNQDGARDVSDLICYIKLVFSGFLLLPAGRPSPPCGGDLGSAANRAVLDVNADQALNVSDIVNLATFIFLGGSPPAQGLIITQISCGFAAPQRG